MSPCTLVRNAARAEEAVELGAKKVLVVPDISRLPEVLGGDYDCVLNTVPGGYPGALFTYSR